MPIAAGKIVAGVLGLGAASVLGYNWITTGCPSGVCPTERAAQAAITTAAFPTDANAKADSCCPSEQPKDCAEVTTVAAVADTQATDSCCPLMAETAAETAAVTTVAATLPAAPAGECCSDKGATEPCNEAKACCQENFGIANNAPANP